MDFSCAFLLFRLVRIGAISADHVVFTFLLYNCLAFGLEFLIGLFFNPRTARFAAFCGEILLIIGLCLGVAIANDFHFNGGIFGSSPIVSFFSAVKKCVCGGIPTFACVLVGVGNAFFHVGGGIDTLTRNRGKNWRSGVFISTGALGLALGMRYGDSPELGGTFASLLFLTTVIATAIWFICKRTDFDLEPCYEKKRKVVFSENAVDKESYWGLIAILFVVFSRSIVGFAAPEIWNVRDLPEFPGISLAVAAFLGKFFGGFGAEFSNARFCGVFAAIAAIPLLCLTSNPILFWVGVLLLNSTTAITLTSAARICGNFVGFAFGLTTLALLGGYFVYDWMAWLLEYHDCLASINSALIALMVFSGIALAFSIK